MGQKHNAEFPGVKYKVDCWGQDNQYLFRTENMLFLLIM